MDILIPNLELPLEERIQLSIYPNGLVVNHSTLDANNRRKAVALPEHGDLIDRNELPIIGITDYKLESHTVVEFEDVLNAPVIVEANNG